MTSHFTFAIGDLNFRTRLPNYEIGSDEHLKAAHVLAEKKDWDLLNKHDELSLALRNKECLVGFLTPRCDFPPTFKIERKDGYSYISKRSPSYTDRILYKANHNLSQMIDLHAYGPIDSFTTSDHKPVRGAFEIHLNQKLRFRPLPKKMKKSRSFRKRESMTGFKNISTGFTRSLQKRESMTETKAKFKARAEIMRFSFSSISCNISQDALFSPSYTPSLCVSFIPTPIDAIETKATGKRWKKVFRKKSAKSLPGIRWPHTQVTNSKYPYWEDEINFKIRSHNKDGSSVNLTGAMLHILVHDAKDNLNLIGSYTLNLSSLITNSMKKIETDGKSSGFRRPRKRMGTSIVAFASKLRQSTVNTMNKKNKYEVDRHVSVRAKDKGESRVSDRHDVCANSKRATQKIVHEVLMKDGKEVGSIKFNIGTMWLS